MRNLPCLLLLTCTLIFGASCKDITSSAQANKSHVLDVLDAIQDAYNNERDANEIILYFHEDYLHDGRTRMLEKQTWQTRLINYPTMTLSDERVELDGDYATAYFKMTLTNSDGDVTTSEPYTHGDFSYFYKDDGTWRVYGNQENYGPDDGYTLSVGSSPDNAMVYVNDTPMFQYTPTTLLNLPAANYNIRLYKSGYNEWETTVNVPDQITVTHTFTVPTLPKPEINFEQPRDGQQLTESAETVAGTIRIRNLDETYSNFDGTKYILTVNGTERAVASTGVIYSDVTLASGENEISIRATGANGHTGAKTIHVYGNF
jgi:hypothetical protein